MFTLTVSCAHTQTLPAALGSLCAGMSHTQLHTHFALYTPLRKLKQKALPEGAHPGQGQGTAGALRSGWADAGLSLGSAAARPPAAPEPQPFAAPRVTTR